MGKTTVDRNDNVKMYKGSSKYSKYSKYFLENDKIKIYNKVNRCLARYSPRATTTSQPINRAPNEPAMVRNAKFGPKELVPLKQVVKLRRDLSANDTSRHPKLLKIGPNHQCQ